MGPRVKLILLIWPNGADLCPDSLYMKVTGLTSEQVFPTLRGQSVSAWALPFFGDCDQDVYQWLPPPHFHAIYGEYEVFIRIGTLAPMAGRLPPRAFGLVIEWATWHKDELSQAWRKAENLEPPGKIEPLDWWAEIWLKAWRHFAFGLEVEIRGSTPTCIQTYNVRWKPLLKD